MDNFYKTCPPKMSDGRHMTDYKESTLLDEQVKFVNGIVRDDEYRMLLQNNGSVILNKEWDYNKVHNSCWVNECVHNYPTYMNPKWFHQELSNYNQLANPKKTVKFVCKKNDDYRLCYDCQGQIVKLPKYTKAIDASTALPKPLPNPPVQGKQAIIDYRQYTNIVPDMVVKPRAEPVPIPKPVKMPMKV